VRSAGEDTKIANAGVPRVGPERRRITVPRAFYRSCWPYVAASDFGLSRK